MFVNTVLVAIIRKSEQE